MKKQYPVMWFKGMPVGPEIFQQQTLYLENLSRINHSLSNSYAWGVSSAEFDFTSLQEGFFKVKKVVGLNENYILFNVDESNNLQINLKDYKDDFKDDKEIFVYLCLPNNEYSQQLNENNPKYSAEYQEVYDLNDKSEKIGISILKENYYLEIGETSSLKNQSLPIAKVKFNGMSFNLTKYTFPTQNIKNSNVLFQNLKDLVFKMKEKVKYLKNIKKASLEQYAQLSNISSILFPLEGLVQSNAHPYEIYKLLTHAVASCFNFSSKRDIPVIEPYNHNKITETLAPFIQYIDANINSIIEAFKLNKFMKDKNIFKVQLNEFLENDLLIAIEKTQGMNYEDLSKWIAEIVIATEDKIEDIKEQRSRGAERFKVENFEELDIQEIPDMFIVKIKVKKSFISNNETLFLFNNDESLGNPSSVYLIES